MNNNSDNNNQTVRFDEHNHPLLNSDLLQAIFEYLQPRDLLNCSVVHSCWNATGNTVWKSVILNHFFGDQNYLRRMLRLGVDVDSILDSSSSLSPEQEVELSQLLSEVANNITWKQLFLHLCRYNWNEDIEINNIVQGILENQSNIFWREGNSYLHSNFSGKTLAVFGSMEENKLEQKVNFGECITATDLAIGKGKYIIVGTQKGKIFKYSIKTKHQEHLKTFTSPISALNVNGKELLIAFGSELAVTSWTSGKVTHIVSAREDVIGCELTEGEIFCVTKSNRIKIWNREFLESKGSQPNSEVDLSRRFAPNHTPMFNRIVRLNRQILVEYIHMDGRVQHINVYAPSSSTPAKNRKSRKETILWNFITSSSNNCQPLAQYLAEHKKSKGNAKLVEQFNVEAIMQKKFHATSVFKCKHFNKQLKRIWDLLKLGELQSKLLPFHPLYVFSALEIQAARRKLCFKILDNVPEETVKFHMENLGEDDIPFVLGEDNRNMEAMQIKAKIFTCDLTAHTAAMKGQKWRMPHMFACLWEFLEDATIDSDEEDFD